jgi:hypothetical protein
VADHGSFPIERIAVDLGGEGKWVGSAGHDDTLKMTDLRAVFEDEEGDEAAEDSENVRIAPASDIDREEPDGAGDESPCREGTPSAVEADSTADSDEDAQASDSPKEKKRKSKSTKNPLAGKNKKARNQINADSSFFKGL